MRTTVACLIAIALSGCGGPDAPTTASHEQRTEDVSGGVAPAPPADRNGAPVAADNSGINKRDSRVSNVTPLDQGASESDRAVTAAIRRGVMAEHGLSVDARNVKIITIDGTVSLRGPVGSEVERVRIGEIARAVAGVHSVDNQLDVARTAGGP